MEDIIITQRKLLVWINFVIGFYNLYLWSVGNSWFNLIIGSLNIGVWVFFRRIND